MTPDKVKELNAARIAANNRDKADEYAAEQALTDNLWAAAVNSFVEKHSGSAAIRADSVFVCKEANLHVVLETAKKMNLMPSIGALETAWMHCKDQLCGGLEDKLTEAEKDKIVAGYLCQRKGLDSRLPLAQLRKHWTKEEWNLAFEACGPKFRKRAIENDYVPKLTGLRVAPQVFRPQFPEVPVVPECVRDLTFDRLVKMPASEQQNLMRVPGAKEHMQTVIDKHHRGYK